MNGPPDSQPPGTAVDLGAMQQRLTLLAIGLLTLPHAAVSAKPFSYDYKSKYAQFDFSWSVEAAAIPALLRQFRTEMSKEKARTISCGKEEYATRRKLGGSGIGCASSTKITTSGQSARLLSLARAYWAFTGGAHGNGATTGILWDRRLGKTIAFSSLFSSPSGYVAALRKPYCEALDAERKKRRGGSGKLGGGISEFDSCPVFSDLAFISGSSGHKGRFDWLHIIAAPYTAGPYVEGAYDVSLPVSRALIEAMKPAYRASFEAQPH